MEIRTGLEPGGVERRKEKGEQTVFSIGLWLYLRIRVPRYATAAIL
jgi:hypothetical protein